MLVEAVKRLPTIDRFLYWISEREKIRLSKKLGKPKPWTDDIILQSYRFCCPRRMDDKVSDWLFKNWYAPAQDDRNMLIACALARFVNLPSTLDAIGFPYRWHPERVKKILRDRRDAGHQTFNGAYVVRGNDGVDKIESVVDFYVGPLAKKPPKIDTSSMQAMWSGLVECYGFGSFMAGQVVADLRWGLSGTWADAKTWAPMGPGSKRGLNRLYGEDPNGPMNQEEFLGRLEYLIEEGTKRLPKSITERLEAIDWQNCCCEADKMERTLFDNRRPKARYPGR